jgi:dolichol kinase
MTTPDLDILVEQTHGAQPWRRVFHAFTGAAIAAVLTFLPISRSLALWILGGALAALLTLDAVRLWFTRANALFFRAFRHLASPREARGPASSTWYALGAMLVVALFDRHDAVSGILVLALADPAASYLGRRWGRRPFLGGSLEGTAVFFLTAFAVLAFRHPLPVASVAALVCALAERLPGVLDDNLTLPVVGATAVALLETLT